MKMKNLSIWNNKKAVWADMMKIILWILVAAVLIWVVYTVSKTLGLIS